MRPEMEYFPAIDEVRVASVPALAANLGAVDVVIAGVSWIRCSHAGFLTFCDRQTLIDKVQLAPGALVLVSHEIAEHASRAFPDTRFFPMDDPRAVFIDAVDYLQRNGLIGVSSLLLGDPSISRHAIIGAGAFVEPGARIDGGVSVGDGAIVRAGVWLKRGVTVGENCVIGSVGINAYLGQDGMRRGFPHLGGVIVGEGSSFGANCVVVRGILSSTRVGQGCIVGNLCNIGHGAEIADDAWVSVGTMIGGHARIGSKASIAMGCRIRDNIAIGEGASVGMGSVVLKDVDKAASVFGNPARSFIGIAAGPAR